MVKNAVYVCAKCGAESIHWQGKCPVCQAWNSIVAQTRGPDLERGRVVRAAPVALQNLKDVLVADLARLATGSKEFDRVLGGGIVPGSLVLLGGEPGIGKSTLVLMVASALSQKHRVLYISGEESVGQIKIRAQRLGVTLDQVFFIGERNLEVILATLKQEKPECVIIDSIQTVYARAVAGEAGGLNQVRYCAQSFLTLAKKMKISMILVGHVTKSGNVAGPKTLEHLVDAVLYLEGDRYHAFRLLRGMKNRFGATDETGVFAMTERGLVDVPNPSQIFLKERQQGLPGSCITVTIEGVRPFLIEVQALCAPTVFGYPKRTAAGVSLNRLQVIIAILTKRAKLRLANQDIYVNLAGGFKIFEPAIDLAQALAIYSAFTDQALPPELVALGELGLSGELRSVSNLKKRLQEAASLGFKQMMIPAASELPKAPAGVKLLPVHTLLEAIAKLK